MKKKNIILLVSSFFLLASWVLSISTGAPSLTYVYSASMEPSIPVNDGFFVLPALSYEAGDIVVFEPEQIDAERVTHRLAERGSKGWITKGDNVAQTDQANGEPEIPESRIIGKVLTINNQPVVIKNLGTFIEWTNETGGAIRIAGVLLILAGLLWMAKDRNTKQLQRKSTNRISLRQTVNRSILVVTIGLFILLTGLSKKETVHYLISENPSIENQHFQVNVGGEMTYTVKNASILPVWYFPDASEPLDIHHSPELLAPFTEETASLSIPPISKIGWRKGTFISNIYPAVLPREVVAFVYAIHPVFASLLTSATIGIILWGLSKLMFYLLRLNPETPLKSFNRRENRQAVKYVKKTLSWSRRE